MCSAISDHFTELKISKNKPLLMHSSLFPLYLVDNPEKCLFDAIKTYLSPSTAFAFPTYILDGRYSYNPSTSDSTLGLFSNYILENTQYIRSYSPIHSHAFYNCDLNPQAINYSSSFGENTDFSLFYELDFDILLFGTDFQHACTYIHHLEALANVPYRDEILIERMVAYDESKTYIPLNYHYYARNNLSRPSEFNKVIPFLGQHLTSATINGFTSYRISVRSMHDILIPKLIADPYFLLANAA